MLSLCKPPSIVWLPHLWVSYPFPLCLASTPFALLVAFFQVSPQDPSLLPCLFELVTCLLSFRPPPLNLRLCCSGVWCFPSTTFFCCDSRKHSSSAVRAELAGPISPSRSFFPFSHEHASHAVCLLLIAPLLSYHSSFSVIFCHLRNRLFPSFFPFSGPPPPTILLKLSPWQRILERPTVPLTRNCRSLRLPVTLSSPTSLPGESVNAGLRPVLTPILPLDEPPQPLFTAVRYWFTFKWSVETSQSFPILSCSIFP